MSAALPRVTPAPLRCAGAARAAGAALLLLLGLRGVAEAHTRVLRSEPASGARLASAPTVLRLQFSDPVELALARLTLIAANGDSVSLSALRRGASGADAIEADILGPAAPGSYRVEWRITGKDGHAIAGRFSFAIDSGVPVRADPGASQVPADSARADTSSGTVTSVEAPPLASATDAGIEPQSESSGVVSVPAVAVKFIAYAAMLVVIGTAAFLFLVLPRVVFVTSGPHSPWLEEAAEQARRLGWLGALALFVIAPLRLIAQVATVTGGEVFNAATLRAIFLDTIWGHAWLLQLVAALLVLFALRRPPAATTAGRPSPALLVIASIGLAVAAALAGHAVVAERVPATVAVALDALHILGAGVWFGALLALVWAGIPAALRLPHAHRGGATRALLASFSTPALTGAALLALSGAASAWIQLGTLAALGSAAYGRLLLVKLGVVALVLAAGAWNWRVVQPSLGSPESAGRARSTAGLEALLMALVLLVTAFLTSTPPPSPLTP